MTEEELLEDLKHLPSDWERSGPNCRIRLTLPDGRLLCPLTAVYFHKTGEYIFALDFRDAASRLGATIIAIDIVRASDRTHLNEAHLVLLRDKMLEAIA